MKNYLAPSMKSTRFRVQYLAVTPVVDVLVRALRLGASVRGLERALIARLVEPPVARGLIVTAVRLHIVSVPLPTKGRYD